VECKLRCINVGRVSEPTCPFQPAFGVTEVSDDWYTIPMGVIVISLGTPQSTREHSGCTWEPLGAPATSLRAPATRLGAPATTLGAPVATLGAPQITVLQSGKNIFFRNTAGGPGNHSYY